MRQLTTLVPRSVRKKLLIIAVAILIVVAVASVAWLLMRHQAIATYNTALKNYVGSTKQTLATASAQFSRADNAESITAKLTKFKTTTQDVIKKLPEEPRVLGIQVIAATEQQSRAELAAKVKALENALDAPHTLVIYKSQVLAAIKDLPGKKGSNANEQKTLASDWQAALDKLKALTPPDIAKSAHADLIKNVDGLVAVLGALPDLYTKKDFAGFETKQKELETKTVALRTLGDTFAAISKDQDKVLAGALHNLQNLLEHR